MTDAEALAIAVRASEHWGGCAELRLIKNRENAVFEMMLPGTRAALRLHRPGYQSPAAIRSELWWVSQLARVGLPVPVPLMTLSQDLLADLGGGNIASAIAWVPGQALGEGGALLRQSPAEQLALHHGLGRLLAQMHTATDSLTLPSDFVRPDWGIEGLLGESPLWGRFWEHPALSAADAAVLQAARECGRLRLAEYRGSQGLIHADVIRENVLAHPGQLTLIDFDDSGFGYRLYDLGTALRDSLHEPLLPAITAALIDGYSGVRTFSAEDRAMLPVFVLLRTLASVGWTMPRLPPDHPLVRVHIDRALTAATAVLSGRDLLGLG